MNPSTKRSFDGSSGSGIHPQWVQWINDGELESIRHGFGEKSDIQHTEMLMAFTMIGFVLFQWWISIDNCSITFI